MISATQGQGYPWCARFGLGGTTLAHMRVRQAEFAHLGKSGGGPSGHETDNSDVVNKRQHHLQSPAQAISAAIPEEAIDIAANA